MKKRIIAIAIIAVMAFGVFAFSGCDLNSDLSEYKASAVTAIEDHAETKISENIYTYQGLEAIEQAVVDSKEAIKNAVTKTVVNTERDKAIQTIDEVPKKNAGTFYTLQKAYDNGLLTEADLQIIANHFNNNTAPNDNLSLELQKAIKETRAVKLRNLNSNPILEATTDDVSIVKYYGSYNSAIVVIITDIYSSYGQGELPEYEVGGVVFYNYGAPEIQIWKR